MKDSLKVSKEWYSWFCNGDIEALTTIDNREMFTETIQVQFKGNCINYLTVFKLLDIFKKTFNFLLIEKIRLIWCEDLKDLQFYHVGQDYEIWKENIKKNGFNIDWVLFAEYEDSTEIFNNYIVNVGGDKTYLYKHNSIDRTAIYLWYNPTTDISHYKLEIELRKSLFKLDYKFNIHLPNSYTAQNMKVLETSKHDCLNELESLR